jgi:hypothetical protein
MVWLWRPDGDLVKEVPATRRVMPLIMRTRNESVVYFEQHIDVSKTRPWLRQQREEAGAHFTLMHLVLWAAGQAIHRRPRLNRFVAGGRLWQRRGIWMCFSGKKGMSDDQPIVVMKRRLDPDDGLQALTDQILGNIKEGRSDRASASDKEMKLLFMLPLFIASTIVRLLMKADHWGLMPGSMIEGDPMYGSMFVANLGSINMEAGFHHLYEYGNVPIFLTMGRANDDDRMLLRYSFDERVEDGLYAAKALDIVKTIVEDPAEHVRL